MKPLVAHASVGDARDVVFDLHGEIVLLWPKESSSFVNIVSRLLARNAVANRKVDPHLKQQLGQILKILVGRERRAPIIPQRGQNHVRNVEDGRLILRGEVGDVVAHAAIVLQPPITSSTFALKSFLVFSLDASGQSGRIRIGRSCDSAIIKIKPPTRSQGVWVVDRGRCDRALSYQLSSRQ